jgi:4-hydroxythreonine-4-phosphate dehydrogenase
MSRKIPLLAVTIGDPGGIGSEIAVQSLIATEGEIDVILIGDPAVVQKAIKACEIDREVQSIDDPADADFDESVVPVLKTHPVDNHQFGPARGDYGDASMAYLERAIYLVKSGKVDGIVGGPVNAKSLEDAKSEFTSPSKMLLHYSNLKQYSIMLLTEGLRVSHVTPEVSLAEVLELVTTDAVFEAIEQTDRELRRMGIKNPRLAVAGLNPHAGLGGLRGTEDDDKIRPAVERAQELGIDATGPESPDTVFAEAINGGYDGVVSMYHDQGHIPVKTIGFGKNEILVSALPVGLPFPYATVRHGTANEIAGEGSAGAASLLNSIHLVADITRSQ